MLVCFAACPNKGRAVPNGIRSISNKLIKVKHKLIQCEKIAGISLTEVFEYASTVKEVNYPKYFAYAGLAIDTSTKELSGAYFGATAREKDSSVTLREIEWNSPAWNAGLRTKDKILAIDGNKANLLLLDNSIKTKKIGYTIKLLIAKGNDEQELTIKLGVKREKTFSITPIANPDALQSAIYTSWMKGY